MQKLHQEYTDKLVWVKLMTLAAIAFCQQSATGNDKNGQV